MREPGYYWVRNLKPNSRDSSDEWESRYWTGNSWIITIDPDFVEDSFFEEIDERRIERPDKTNYPEFLQEEKDPDWK